MKLIDYAHKMGISYRTAWRWYKAGKIAGKQMDTGTILVTAIIYSFCARLYRQRRAKRKTEKIVQELEAEQDATG